MKPRVVSHRSLPQVGSDLYLLHLRMPGYTVRNPWGQTAWKILFPSVLKVSLFFFRHRVPVCILRDYKRRLAWVSLPLNASLREKRVKQRPAASARVTAVKCWNFRGRKK